MSSQIRIQVRKILKAWEYKIETPDHVEISTRCFITRRGCLRAARRHVELIVAKGSPWQSADERLSCGRAWCDCHKTGDPVTSHGVYRW
jgi:hypothetical protein